MIWLTLAILLTPPIKTAATQKERIREAMTTDQEYSPRNGRIFYSKGIVWIKETMYCTGNTIDLAEGTNAEETDTDAEEGENLCEPFKIFCPCRVQYSRRDRRGCVRLQQRYGI